MINRSKAIVTVIIPAFNAEQWTLEAIASVQRQTFKDWSAIIIDDGSLMKSQKALRAGIELLNDHRITFVALGNNQGVAAARNLGLELAESRFIAFLDSDDLWHHEKLEKQLHFLEVNDAVLSFTSYVNTDSMGKILSRRVPPTRVDYKKLLPWNVIGNSTVILDRSKIDLPRIPNLRRRQDFAFWLKILRMGHIGHGLQEPLTERRLRPNSLSENKLISMRDTWRMYRFDAEIHSLAAIWHFSRYLAYSARQQILNLRPVKKD